MNYGVFELGSRDGRKMDEQSEGREWVIDLINLYYIYAGNSHFKPFWIKMEAKLLY